MSSLLILQSASSSNNLQLCGAGFSTALHLYCMHSKSHPFIWPKLSSHKSWSPNSYLTSHPHLPSFLLPLSQYICFCLPWFVHLFLAWVCAHLRLTHCNIWIVARQAPLSTGFSRRECWSGLSFCSSVDLLNPGIKPKSPVLAGSFFTAESPGKSMCKYSAIPSTITVKHYHWSPPLLWEADKKLLPSPFHQWWGRR